MLSQVEIYLDVKKLSTLSKTIDIIETFSRYLDSVMLIFSRQKIVMNYLSENDIYEIRIASLISNVDKDVIIELYQPLIGSLATMLYLTLLKQKRNEDDEIAFPTSLLLSSMQITLGKLLEARRALEGVGLLRTYIKAGENNASYIYMLYAPKSPKDFFDDVLFKGLIIQYLGEKETKRLAFHYRVDLKISDEYKEISASFVDIFNPDYDDASFRKNISESLIGHNSGRVKMDFSVELFNKYIEENSQINSQQLNRKDIKEIERIATLFGLNEKSMAFIIIDEYDSSATPHIDYSKVFARAEDQIRYPMLQKRIIARSKVSGDGVLASKVKLMERKSPAEWLQLLQNNTKPASSDLKIVNDISLNYGFSKGVINVIIDYVLHKNNNILSNNYCEKIAASLARENVTTAVDAMNYLNGLASNNKKNKKSLLNEEKDDFENKEDKENKKEEDSISNEEMEVIFAKFDKKGSK